MIRRKLLLAIAIGTASFGFVMAACSSTPSSSNQVTQPVSDAAAPLDSAPTEQDVAVAADSASPAVDSSAPSDSAKSDDDAAAVCVGCASRLSVTGPDAPTCTTNGPPSSHQLLNDWGMCLCQASTCAATCEVCSNGQAAVTQACINCGHQACPSQYAACAADTAGFTDDAGD